MPNNNRPTESISDTGGISVREFYQLLDQKIGQVNTSIMRLENKLDNLESGRLSLLEKDISTMQGRITVIPILISIAMAVFSFLVNKVIT